MNIIDLEKLKPVLNGYKSYFPEHWEDEKFKWEAVKHFQHYWNIDAENFGDMFKEATAKAGNLMTSRNAYTRDMIINFAEADDEAVRTMFRDLYDEAEDLAVRVEDFIKTSKKLYEKYNDGKWNSPYQDINSASTFLWLRYPDKYYIYRYTTYRDVAEAVSIYEGEKPKYKPKAGAVDSMIGGFAMYDEICTAIKADRDITAMIKAALDLAHECCSDPEMKTATIDLGFYFERYYLKEKNAEQEHEASVENGSEELPEEVGNIPKYTKADFLSEVYMTSERYDTLTGLLRNKMNVILQGAPGVGKTFIAKRLAYAMMGEKDDSRIKAVQFHQNYSYEDFVMGYRPYEDGFRLNKGVFYSFCKTAENQPEKSHFFIIDEINRGNMSKILGELLMLIEKDYRGTKVTPAYSDEQFSVPKNIYIIGMMNTADRSLAMIDYALRRRFSFFDMEPGFDSEGFKSYRKSLGNETFNALIELIKELNIAISDDKSLGRGFQIGHSYFCGREKNECTEEWMRSVVEFDILPMLSEYWFDEPEKLQRWEGNLNSVFKAK